MAVKQPEWMPDEDWGTLTSEWLLRVRKGINKICPNQNIECPFAHRPKDSNPHYVQCWADERKYAADILEKCPRKGW